MVQTEGLRVATSCYCSQEGMKWSMHAWTNTYIMVVFMHTEVRTVDITGDGTFHNNSANVSGGALASPISQ